MTFTIKLLCTFGLLCTTTPAISARAAVATRPANQYVVVVSSDTLANPSWGTVVETLVRKHDAETIVFKSTVDTIREDLAARHPRYTCFVAQPQETTRGFVAKIHQLAVQLDSDPYTDTLWGILTGYDAACALRIAKHAEPLSIHSVVSATEIALEMVDEGCWYSELEKGAWVSKDTGGEPRKAIGPADTTELLVKALNEGRADLFVTSGHATERDWQIGFAYPGGSFRSKAGQLVGRDTRGREYPVNSPNPKVYLPIGNCLMGHIDGPDAMALAWMNCAGVYQMIGYTVPTWFGYAGWGCLDYFVEQPGRYTLTEAFFANHHALVHSLETGAGNRRGLEFDRHVVAFYGDPAWVARMAERPRAYEQHLTEEDGLYTFTFRGNRGKASFEPINTNGSQRGWRPIVEFLPHRLQDIEIVDDGGLQPVVADDFILVPNPKVCDPQRVYRITFRGNRIAVLDPVPSSSPEAVVSRTGPTVPQMSSFDRTISEFVAEHEVPGASVAVTDQGRLVYARGFGYADKEAGTPVQPTSLFRIASLSKPITAVAVLRLVEQGKLALDDHVFDLLNVDPFVRDDEEQDTRLRDVTVRHLLQHRGGWDRDASFDPMFQSVKFARLLGVEPPVEPGDIIRIMSGKPLDFAPGERYAYSNYGYCLLGRVIEAVSGRGYEQFVKDEVLTPLGIAQMRLGKTRLTDRLPNEVCYYDPGRGPCVFADALGQSVASPYGAWCLESMDAHGGWLASAVDLARFAAAFDRPDACPILKLETIHEMSGRPPGNAGHDELGRPKDVYYSLGWLNRSLADGSRVNHWHTGSLPGTSAILIRRHDGRNFVALLNSRVSPSANCLSRVVDPLLHRAANQVSAWPEIDLFPEFGLK